MILRNIQRSDLNLLAAYRKIPILGAAPTTITYTRAARILGLPRMRPGSRSIAAMA